jgi:hypothetical protein
MRYEAIPLGTPVPPKNLLTKKGGGVKKGLTQAAAFFSLISHLYQESQQPFSCHFRSGFFVFGIRGGRGVRKETVIESIFPRKGGEKRGLLAKVEVIKLPSIAGEITNLRSGHEKSLISIDFGRSGDEPDGWNSIGQSRHRQGR